MANGTNALPAKLLVVEFNEVSPLLFEQAAAEMNLPNLKRLLALEHAQTTTEDEVEHQGLDPWVQWVGVHTGQPTSEHNIRRLGLTTVQTDRQIWQELGRRGHRWGVWGVMNGPRGEAPGCDFFMPDPWSFEERAYPEALNDLLALPRYSATNYLEIDRKAALAAALRLVRYFLPPTRWPTAMRTVTKLVRSLGDAGANVHTFSTLFDYVSVLVFSELRGRQRPDFSLIFLNHVAHLQHQFWNREGPLDPNMRFGLRIADEVVGMLLDSRQPGEAILFANGMRQRNVVGEGFYVYRQTHPQRAIDGLGVVGGRVEQCMTHDAHILFDDAANADRAMQILAACKLPDGAGVFYVERVHPTKLFYQLAFDNEVSGDTMIQGPAGAVRFGELFELICARTGAHEQRGDVFFDGIQVPSVLANHELFDVMMGHFGAAPPMMMAAE
jgi:hypothetical protein